MRAAAPRRANPIQTSWLARSALEFAARCHAQQRRDSDGAPFIQHPVEVARLLRDAGCSEVVVAAGLLHDVLESAEISMDELTARFGEDVATLVHAVTDGPSVQSYRRRKQELREQVRSAGLDAALLFAADKIARVRELPAQVDRDQVRLGSSARDSRARAHCEHYQQMRLEHYHESLAMVGRVAPRHPLVQLLASELDACPVAVLEPGVGMAR